MAAAGGEQVMPMPDFMLGSTRTMVTMMQFNGQKQDYTSSIEGLEVDSEAYRQALEACHQRGAQRCLQVAQMQRGLYVKAAQFIASIRGGTGDRGIPRAYTDALAVFTDHAPCQTLEQVAEPLKAAMPLGGWPQTELDGACALRSIESVAIQSGSLAQVHRAVLQDGSVVAVKVQYPSLRKEMASDFAVFKTMGAQIKSMSDGYDFMWVVEDFEKNLSRELDFKLEAANGEQTAAQLAHLAPRVFVPRVYNELSSAQVLTMEFCDGLLKVNDADGLRKAGLDVEECAALICETFAEMIFIHGRVHADPHAGNIYFRAIDAEGGGKRPQLVVLDHGLYFDLSENDVRHHFCKYWRACCAKDSAAMNAIGRRFAGNLFRFLPVILSPWFIFGGAGVSLGEVLSAAKGQLPDTIKLRDVADFVVATREGGANLIGLLHSLGYTRGLLESLNFPEGRRVACMLKFAILGDSLRPPPVPPPLTLAQRMSLNWQVTFLGGHIRLLAPLVWPLRRYAKAENAPPLWLLTSLPVLLVATGAAAVVAFVARPSAWHKYFSAA